MKKYTKIFSFTLPVIVAFSSCFFMAGKEPAAQGNKKDEVIQQMMVGMLQEAHYNPPAIDDEFSHRAFDLYIKRADYQKKLFLQSDIDDLKKYYNKIDDEMLNDNFDFFEASIAILTKRVAEDQDYYRDILAKPFDFKTKESVELDPEKAKFPKDKSAMKDEWRKYLKYQVMSRFVDLKDEQDKAIADKKPDLKVKTDSELEADARAKVLKIEDETFDRLNKVKREDRMATYLNVLTSVYDPHTEFFPPKDKENFDIAMSGQLEGIGAQLQEKDGYIKITNIVPGSPSWKDGHLKAGDAILKVGQRDEEPVDVVGMDIDDAIKMIRGKKGTEVRLTVKKVDGTTQLVKLIRDVVVLEETFAQSAVVKKDGKKFGYIKLPSFYADFNGTGGHGCADDVKKELLKLEAEKVDGIMLDLRDNGGGSLQEVVKMVGLFISDGPVVHVRSRGNEIKTYDDPDHGQITYSGPLVVMVNEGSASASEILAAAIQDYKRGLIVGSTSSFGKGTVQTFFDLDRFVTAQSADLRPLGQVKITIQKFYRVNGGSTQLKGVIPDVVLPDMYAYIDLGEKEQDFPMAWDEIQPKPYTPWKAAPDYAAQKSASNSRVSNDPAFKLISERALELKADRDNTMESLNIDDYRADLKKREADKDKYKPLEEEVKTMSVAALDADLKDIGSDTSKVARKNAWVERVKKDVYVNEVATMIETMK